LQGKQATFHPLWPILRITSFHWVAQRKPVKLSSPKLTSLRSLRHCIMFKYHNRLWLWLRNHHNM